jgi:methionyl-tRNA formyltransferase
MRLGGSMRARLTPASRKAPLSCRAYSLRVAFFGTDDVSLKTLERLTESLEKRGNYGGIVSALDVVCPGDRPAGRGQKLMPVPVRRFADSKGLRCHTVPYGLRDLRQWDASCLGPQRPDVGVVVSFGYFITPNVLSMLQHGAINMHPSLLPRYRGSAPIPHAILNGDRETGVSVITIHPTAFDAGAILHQQTVPICEGEPSSLLTPRLASIGADAVLDVLAHFPERLANARSQPKECVTKAPKLKPEMAALDITAAGNTADRIVRMSRAFDDSIGIYMLQDKEAGKEGEQPVRIKLLEVVPVSAQECAAADALFAATAPAVPGQLLLRPGGLLLMRTLDGWVHLVRLQPATRKPMGGKDFANGRGITVNMVEGPKLLSAR